MAVVSQLVACNSCSALLRVLAALTAKEVHAGEAFVSDLVWLLSRIALRGGWLRCSSARVLVQDVHYLSFAL